MRPVIKKDMDTYPKKLILYSPMYLKNRSVKEQQYSAISQE